MKKMTIIFLLILISGNMELNAKNNNCIVFRHYIEILNPPVQEFISEHYITLDLKNKRYQIKSLLTLGDIELMFLISQGIFKINKEEIKLIDKNNSIITKGVIKNDSIIINSGVKYLIGKVFCKDVEQLGIVYGVLEFLNWNDVCTLKYKNNKSDVNIRLGTYSEGCKDDEPGGIVLELTQKEYSLYCMDGNKFKYYISSGIWQIKSYKLKLKDYDNLNNFEMYILDDSTIIPSTKLPVTDGLSPLKLKLSHYEDGEK